MPGIESIEKAELQHAIEELYYWQRVDHASNFTTILYTLISKADINNSMRLAYAFPAEWNAYRLWQDSPDEEAFFKEWIGHGAMRKRAR